MALANHELRVETDRFGPFTLQVGVDAEGLVVPLQRVEDAHELFVKTPLNQVASRLEKAVVVSSVFGTNTIEGGKLTEDETATALNIDPTLIKEVEQRRAVNIKAAYDLSQKMAAKPGWSLNIDFTLDLHRLITREIPHPDYRPGLARNNPKNRLTFVGDEAPGGRYKPPQSDKEIRRLLEALIEWHQGLVSAEVPALIRAP